jgi:tetratricopeptide (TPR) repeat protein
MVSQLLSLHELPASLRQLILGKAEGNPFFVEEVIRTLIERGALMHANGQGWVTTAIIDNISVPDTLQGLLMARLDRLPDETKWVVQQASVIGRIFLYRVLLQMAENQASVDADLTQLEREELIRERARDPEIEYIFKHALTQEVAYQSLLAPRRRELHRKVGEAMEMLFAQRISEFQSIIGHHMLRGEVWGKAAMHLIAAGDSAARLYAHAEAREHYAGALDAIAHLPDTTDNRIRRIDATIRLVSVSVVSDDPGQNLARLHAVEPLAQSLPSSDGKGDPLRLARIHYWMGRSHFYRNESREAIGYYRQVLAVAQETGDPELLALPASTLGQVALLIQGQFARARPLLAQAVAPLEHAGDWSEWIRAVGYLGLATAAMGEYRQGLVESERALARARETHNLTGAALVYLLQSGIYLQGREHHRMVETVQACLALNEQTGDRLQAYIAHAELAWAQSRLGDHAGAAESMARSQEIGSALGGRLVTADWFAAANAELALNAGQFDLAAERALSAIQVAQGVGSAFSEGMACRIYAEALAHLAIGRWAEAQAQFAASVQRLESGGALLEVAHTRAAWGRELAAHGDASGARTSLEQAEAQFARSELAGPAQAVRVLLDGLVEEQRA